MDTFAYSLVTESFNVVDGQSFGGLAGAMAALRAIAASGDAEFLITDAIGDGRVQALAAEADVPVRVLDATGLDYDAQKNRAAAGRPRALPGLPRRRLPTAVAGSRAQGPRRTNRSTTGTGGGSSKWFDLGGFGGGMQCGL